MIEIATIWTDVYIITTIIWGLSTLLWVGCLSFYSDDAHDRIWGKEDGTRRVRFIRHFSGALALFAFLTWIALKNSGVVEEEAKMNAEAEEKLILPTR